MHVFVRLATFAVLGALGCVLGSLLPFQRNVTLSGGAVTACYYGSIGAAVVVSLLFTSEQRILRRLSWLALAVATAVVAQVGVLVAYNLAFPQLPVG